MKHTLAFAFAAALVLGGCATIMQGTTQDVSVGSSPTGAQVWVDGRQMGVTPVVLDLKRKDKHVLAIKLDGYQPYEIAFGRKVSGWVAGNIVFGGLIGLAVDAATGGMYKLNPDQVNATLQRGAVASRTDGDELVILVVLEPDPSWQQIGRLAREDGAY